MILIAAGIAVAIIVVVFVRSGGANDTSGAERDSGRTSRAEDDERSGDELADELREYQDSLAISDLEDDDDFKPAPALESAPRVDHRALAKAAAVEDDIWRSFEALQERRQKAELAAAAEPEVEVPVVPHAPEEEASPTGENRFVTLSVSGSLNGKPLNPNDPQTWARVGYFLQEESARPYALATPGGGTPLVRHKDADPEAPVRGRGAASGGDPSAPLYRIVILANAQSAGSVTFYGKTMASKFTCSIMARIQMREVGGYADIGGFSVNDTFTPQRVEGSTQAFVRKVYDLTLEKFVKRLGVELPFR